MLHDRLWMLIVLLGVVSTEGMAQKLERDYLRKGNSSFKDSIWVDAEVDYRKALEVNPQSTITMYNLGTTLLQQQKAKDAMEQYVAASRIEKDKDKLAQIYHNMGVVFHASKEYDKAVEAYKESLRNNPKDHETRYNLVLAQKMLKDQQQQQQNQDNKKDKQEQQQDKNQKDQKQNQDQNKQQQKQNPQQQKDKNQMSKENAEQLLNSVMQDEKDTQEKVKKQQQVVGGRQLEKNW